MGNVMGIINRLKNGTNLADSNAIPECGATMRDAANVIERMSEEIYSLENEIGRTVNTEKDKPWVVY